MIARIIGVDPIIPATDNPANIKVPDRKIGIQIIKQMAANIVPVSNSIFNFQLMAYNRFLLFMSIPILLQGYLGRGGK